MHNFFYNFIWNYKYQIIFVGFIFFLISAQQIKDLKVFSGPERILKSAQEKNTNSNSYDENTFLVGLNYNKPISYHEIQLLDSIVDKLENDSNISSINSLLNDFRIYNTLIPTKRKIIDLSSEDKFFKTLNKDSSYYISKNLKNLMLIVEIKDSIFNGPEKYYHKIKNEFSKLNTEETYVSALVASRLYFQGKVIKNLIFILISCSLFCCIILYFFYRNLYYVLINIVSILFGIVFCLAFSNFLYGGIELLMIIVPVIVFIICISDLMHLTNLSQNIILKGKELFIFQLNEIGFPITITSFTTAIGFLSFISSDLVPISRLGVISSFGILVSLFTTIILFAISIDLKIKITQKKNFIISTFQKVIKLLNRTFNKRIAWLSLLLSLSLIVLTFSQTKINNFITDEINEKSKIYHDVQFFEKNFGGMKYISFFIDIDDKFEIQQLISFEDFIIEKGFSPFFPIKKHIAKYEALLTSTFKKYSSNPYQIKTRTKDLGSYDSLEKIQLIKNKAKKLNLSLSVGGAGYLFDQVSNKITLEVLFSLMIAILIISLLFVIINNFNLKYFLVALIPNLTPLLLCVGLLSFFDFYLSLSNVFVFAIVFGLIVDDSTHILSAYSFNINKGLSKENALVTAISTTSIPILKTTVIIVASMIPLLFSEFRSLNYLSIICIISSIIALFFDIIILPFLVRKLL